MDSNSFSFMKQGFDWQSAQSKDMTEIREESSSRQLFEKMCLKEAEDRHNSDEEELRRESAELRDYNDFFDMEDR